MLPTSAPQFRAAAIVEYREVAEGRVLHGRDMTFHAPMFGTVYSAGGTVSLDSACGWGSVINPSGTIKGRKRSFNASLHAPGGVVELASAESCLIIGRDGTIHEAVKCQIFAHTLRIGKAAGCLIAGRDVQIGQATPYRHEPNVINMVVPEMSEFEAMLRPLNAELAELQSQSAALSASISRMRADPALTQYLTLRAKVRTGMIKLTDEHSKDYLEMGQLLGDAAKALEGNVAQRTVINRAIAHARHRVQAIDDTKSALLAQCKCNVDQVLGETLVRQLLEAHNHADLSVIPEPRIPKILFRNDASLKFLYASHHGSVNWTAVSG